MFPEMFRSFSPAKKIITIINGVFFFIFLLIIVYNLNRTPLFQLLIGLFFFLSGLYLLYLQDQADRLHYLFYERLQPEEAEKIAERLQKADFLHLYRQKILTYRIDQLLYHQKGQEALELIRQDNKLKGKERLIYELRTYLLLKDYEQLLESCYRAADEDFEDDLIRGIYYRGKNDPASAYQCFALIEREKLNTYEKKYVLENLIACAPYQDKEKYQQELDQLSDGNEAVPADDKEGKKR